jgi:DNA-binding NarL/FixJ family response regulator
MKLLVIDDHVVVREGLTAMLRQAEPETVVIQACDAREGLAIAKADENLDAVFLDLTMPGMGGMASIGEFGRQRPDLPVIVLSATEDPAEVQRALKAGAMGYVPKSAKPQALLLALKLVLAGERYVPPLLLDASSPDAKVQGVRGTPGGIGQLTQRQTDILKLVARGRANKEIASELNLSEKTVKAHITAVLRTLGVENRTQAASAAREAGLI